MKFPVKFTKMKFLSLKFNIPLKCLIQPFMMMGAHGCVRRYCFLPKATTLESCVVESCSVNPCNPEPRVVIVGAGMAGLSAAQRLVQCGIQNFIVLEATERPGGRIRSCWLGDVVAELGAQWIFGASSSNSVYTLATQEHLLTEPLSRRDATKGIFCTSDGRPITARVTVPAHCTFSRIEQQAASLHRLGSGGRHGTLKNFIALRIQQELQNFPEHQKQDAARVMFGLSHVLRNRLGDDLSLVSADEYGSYIEIPGGSVHVPSGFEGVLAPMLRQIPNNAIRYLKSVNNIKWGDLTQGSGVRAQIQCCDGEVQNADYVIVTVSLGCLKCHAERLFCPALPPSKIEAIDALGFGMFNKIFLQYAKPFWVSKEGDLRLGRTAEENNRKGEWTCGVSAVEESPDSSQLLCVSISGEEAAHMETLAERDVAEGITRLLRQFLCNPSLPYPNSILRSMWASDPNFCGANSYLRCGSNVGHQRELGEPLPQAGSSESTTPPPILLFAGEATVAGYFSTVHGARLSGFREAERIITLTNKLGGPPR